MVLQPKRECVLLWNRWWLHSRWLQCCGLSSQVPYYDYVLDLILDIESSHGDIFTEEQNELVESAAEMLYGLIHARYILTSKGLAAMLEKYKNYDFGRCPRVYCCGQPCLPVGQSDIHRSSTVKIYCPKCEDIYYPRSKYQGSILITLLLYCLKLVCFSRGEKRVSSTKKYLHICITGIS